MLDRRSLIVSGSLAGTGLLFAPRIALARASTQRRLVFVIQRGAADGLGTLAPTGDPAYAGLRGALAADFADAQQLGGMFALHPALAQVAKLHGAKQALFVHAAASPYRDRSHFDGQNVLETGGNMPYDVKSGWLNRLVGLLPASEARALAISATIPAALRGPAQVASYAPSNLPRASDDLLNRVTQLYQGDALLHPLWAEAMATRAMAGDLAADGGRGAAATGALAASLMTGDQGARVVMIETGGWDTHAGQLARLRAQLVGLDALIGALQVGLGPAWADTLVVVATEFGRTAAVNGTGGTDHGTASLAMLLGGTVVGGRIVADWPGLATASLYEGRDLRPTASLDATIAGAVAQHFALDPALAMKTLFPGGTSQASEGLVVT
ncbi:DUF1501 domain-containing protein [Novosphingobium sp. Gsoil 351]|uniref:DUF1501 domain-containing protein n=1 Tax=Novosphingobium sp. Gsoil 351 TaxID=2675225 RepID=UPI0012B4C5E9|nr:DUF1501 domain-containing protein [Novosphingobium sp. Gsoil 351]QGN54143.1 DUF1501 domain-containing protein [Novosphingobium sp. Gsoil 351]